MIGLTFKNIYPLLSNTYGDGFLLSEADKWWVILWVDPEEGERAYLTRDGWWGADWFDEMLMFDQKNQAQAYADALSTNSKIHVANFGDVVRSGRVPQGKRKYASSKEWWVDR